MAGYRHLDWMDALPTAVEAPSIAGLRVPRSAPEPTVEEVLAGPAPCDDCWRSRRCAAAREACSAFKLYVDGGSPARWALAPRADACARMYGRIYSAGQVGRPRKAA